MTKIYLDTETRSDVPIDFGASAYVNGKDFAVIMVQYAIDDGPVQIWEPQYEEIPQGLVSACANSPVYVIHNSVFDRIVINKSGILGVEITPERIIDTMVQAYAHGFPGSLDVLSTVLGLPQDKAKDKRGKQLIKLFCVPNSKGAFITKEERPAEWEVFREYGLKDVEAMRIVHKRLPQINYPKLEHHIWVYDQRINDRGIPVDVDFAKAAVEVSEKERQRLNERTMAITGGVVQAATQRDKMIEFIRNTYGIELDALKQKDLEDYIAHGEMPDEMRRLLTIRVQSAMNSSAKYKRILEHQTDGRMRYTLQMYGATRTGRDAGRVMQPQNLRRATLWKDADDIGEAIELDVKAVKSGVISFVSDNVMLVLSDLIRSVITASDGMKLVSADYSNIEGRGLAYLAGEDWKIQYFRDYDAGKIKFDNYKMAYAKAMNIKPEEVTKDQRQIGKVQELGLGYEGGVSAFLTFAAVYRLDISQMAKAVWSTGDVVHLEECRKKYEWASTNGYDGGLPEREYAACEYLKQLWRAGHPNVVRFWSDLSQGWRTAYASKGDVIDVGKLKFKYDKSYMMIRLPSGRCLMYLLPGIDEDGALSFVGVDQFTKKFQRIKTYSGKLAENVTSAFARDILFHHIPAVEDAGYRIVSRVHDELVCEVPNEPRFNPDDLGAIMTTPLPWCADMPLAAAGFEAHRYRKD